MENKKTERRVPTIDVCVCVCMRVLGCTFAHGQTTANADMRYGFVKNPLFFFLNMRDQK